MGKKTWVKPQLTNFAKFGFGGIKMNRKIYVRPHMRRNKKNKGKHFVKGHYRGIKTKFKDKKNHNKMEDFEEDSKTYTFYHGTSLERANKILEEGLKKKNWSRPIYLSPSKETAKEYAKTKRVGKYLTETQSRDDGVILKIKITEDDLEKEGVSPETVEARKENLRKSVKEGWNEYALYHKIPPDNIELEEYL